MTDYKTLLKEYMEHVLDCEGCDFTDHVGRYMNDVSFTEEEKFALYKISDQIMEER